MKKLICSMVFGMLLAVAAPAATTSDAEPVLDAEVIERMANTAKTPADHAEVARQYRIRAKSLEAKADKLENEVRQQKAARTPMETKWPAMVVNARERKVQLAMQARRAAQESFELAERHSNLAGENRAAE